MFLFQTFARRNLITVPVSSRYLPNYSPDRLIGINNSTENLPHLRPIQSKGRLKLIVLNFQCISKPLLWITKSSASLNHCSLSCLSLASAFAMAVNFFRLEKRFISSMWFWPSPDLMTSKEVLKIIVNSVLMMTALTGEVLFAIANFKSNLPIALNALGPVASKFSVLLKVLLLYYYRMEVKECLAMFKRRMDSGLSLNFYV